MTDAETGVVPVQEERQFPHLDKETVHQLLAQQEREVELRSREMDIRMVELQNNSQHAEKILGAQERDRKDERDHVRKMSRDKLLFGALIVLVIVAVVLAGIYFGKDQLVHDLIQILSSALLGGAGGYGLGKKSSKDESNEE